MPLYCFEIDTDTSVIQIPKRFSYLKSIYWWVLWVRIYVTENSKCRVISRHLLNHLVKCHLISADEFNILVAKNWNNYIHFCSTNVSVDGFAGTVMIKFGYCLYSGWVLQALLNRKCVLFFWQLDTCGVPITKAIFTKSRRCQWTWPVLHVLQRMSSYLTLMAV